MHLRHAAQTVSILHARIVLQMRLANLTVAQKLAQMRGNFHLASVRPRSMNTLIECGRRPAQGFERHGAGNVGQSSDPLRAM